MLFSYKGIDKANVQREGTVDASNIDAAINALQRRGYVVSSIEPITSQQSFLNFEITWFQRISTKETVILTRQLSTLFEAQVSALRIFRLLATEADNPLLQQVMTEIADDLQGGSSISRALSQHPDVFSPFYVSMVKAGEEAGTLDSVFGYLADHLDRTYEVITKARNALIYPAFVVATFIVVMGLMLVLVIPRISDIITSSGQDVPIYTRIIIGFSSFLTDYIGPLFLLLAVAGFFLWRFARTEVGARTFDELQLTVPYLGSLYQKLFLTRIADNLSTMLSSGISMVQALEITAEVVDNRVFKEIIGNAVIDVKAGKAVSDALAEYPQIPGVMAQMMKVGEETGNLGKILQTLAKFYRREVNNAVDNLISLIEPAMIVVLGLGVGFLLASVLIPIYNISSGI